MTDNRIPVTTEFPLLAYRALAEIADRQGVRAGVIVEQIVAKALVEVTARLTREQLLNKIVILHGRGYNDREIADHLGVNKERVRQYRNKLRLPANDARGTGNRKTYPKEQAA